MSRLGFKYNEGGAERTPLVKYDARAGRMFRVDRTQTAQGWESSQEDITSGFQAIMDLENIEIGYMHFPMGGTPSVVTQPIAYGFPPQPSPDHKQGFRLVMKLGKSVADGQPEVREMTSSAKVVLKAIDTLYEAFLEGSRTNPGKLPVIKLTKTVAVVSEGKGGKSTNYAPVLDIVKWVDRPADLVGKATPTPAAVSGPPSTGSTAAPPPVARTPEPAMADAIDDFG